MLNIQFRPVHAFHQALARQNLANIAKQFQCQIKLIRLQLNRNLSMFHNVEACFE